MNTNRYFTKWALSRLGFGPKVTRQMIKEEARELMRQPHAQKVAAIAAKKRNDAHFEACAAQGKEVARKKALARLGIA